MQVVVNPKKSNPWRELCRPGLRLPEKRSRRWRFLAAAGAVIALLLLATAGMGQESGNRHPKPPGDSNPQGKPGPAAELPPRTNFHKRIGIVYSDTSAKRFYDKFAYSELFMAMQHQAMMAGIPFDLLSEDDLVDVANLVNYDALLLPCALNLPDSKYDQISDSLETAVSHYKIGLITAGDLATLNEKGLLADPKPYQLIRELFGLRKITNLESVPVQARVETVTHPVMRNYQPNEIIYSSTSDSLMVYGPAPGQPATVLASLAWKGSSYPAVIATETGGRNVYFANPQLIGIGNLVWSALQWVVFGDDTPVGLKLTRQKSLFTSRNDMDQSRYIREISRVEIPLYDLLEDWKTRYNFVGTYFLNVGNNRAAGEYTDWNVSVPLYRKYMALGNEIGCHTYTHPHNLNKLTRTQWDFEFNTATSEIESHLGIQIAGAAIPGMDEKFSIDSWLDHYFIYTTGRYGNAGAGYPGAIGWPTPDFHMLYFCHQLQTDFYMLQFRKMTATQAQAQWQREYDNVLRHASRPIVHWHWHDYGPLASTAFGYNLEMYESILRRASSDDTEFATMFDVQDRIKAFQSAQLAVEAGDSLTAGVEGQNLGRFCLAIPADKTIASVEGWYAYNEDSILLPNDGRSFAIHLGAAPDPLTHLVFLPMRASLLAVDGNGRDLSFTFDGEGQAGVWVNAAPGATIDQAGADAANVNGNLLTLTFNGSGLHTARITIR